MLLEFEVNNKSLIVGINSEVDHHSSVILREKIDKEIEQISAKNLIFDFKNVGFMDSSGVGLIIGRYKNIDKSGGKVGIVNMAPQIKRIFEISGLFKIISEFENLADALKTMEKGEY